LVGRAAGPRAALVGRAAGPRAALVGRAAGPRAALVSRSALRNRACAAWDAASARAFAGTRFATLARLSTALELFAATRCGHYADHTRQHQDSAKHPQTIARAAPRGKGCHRCRD